MTPPVKHLLEYSPVEGFLPLAQQHAAAHQERLQAFADRGVLLMAGPLDDPPSGAALAVFTTREAAEEFAVDDPFVTGGVVASWRIRPWREVLAP
jgi:uncharacterized protein YciI